MDPFELSYYSRRPPLVKASATPHDFDFEDHELFDRVLGTPNKIEIPERYIPEQPSVDPEEEAKRSKKAAAICRILSKSSAGALAQQLRLPLLLPNSPRPKGSGCASGFDLTPTTATGGQSHKSLSNGGSTSGFSSGSNSRIPSVNGSLPTSPVRRIPLRTGRRSGSATPSSSSRCDWSLAGVSAPYSPYLSASDSERGRERERERVTSDYYSSTGSFSLDPTHRPTNRGNSNSNSNSWKNSHGHQGQGQGQTYGYGAVERRRSPEVKSKSSSYSALLLPSHSYHSSVSSTSSSDREELLHLQHSLAREVTEKSRIVAVRALSASPGQGIPHRYSPLRPPTPPSPSELPTIQQREGFFT